ncbi:MAG: Plug domain-containing protein [Sediminibacterium sp.]
MNKLVHKAFYIILIFFAFVCNANICEAQLRIDGKLIDHVTGGAIASALVTLQDRSSGLVLVYTISDKNGSFKVEFKNKSGNDLWLIVNALGYHQDTIAVKNQLGGLAIQLIPFPEALPPVIVKRKKSFLNIKPDTSSYKTEAFVQKQDRTIEDVLKKIPGIAIEGTGRISYNGKNISNFYIDGDDIVSDRYTIATRSISPEMVDKIQVIENHNAIKVLESAVLSNNTALNLSLKDEARLALMGNVSGALGNGNTYKTNADLLSFKKQFKFINQVKVNNVGAVANEISPHNLADLTKRLDQNITKSLIGLSTIASPDIEQQKYLFNRTGLLTLNNSIPVKPETKIRLNIHYLDDQRSLTSNSHFIYRLPAVNFAYDESKLQETRNKSLITQLTLTVNSKNFYLNNIFSFNKSLLLGDANSIQNRVKFSQQYDNKNWSISNDLNIINKKANRNITELNSFVYYQNLPENLKVNPSPNDSIFNVGFPYQTLNQHANLSDFFTHQSFSYRIVNDFLVQSYKAGIVVQLQQLGSDISTVDNQGAIKQLADSFVNNLIWKQYKTYVKSDYDIVRGKTRLSISIPLYLHYIQKGTGISAIPENFTKALFSPSIRWRYELNNENNISTSYQYNASPTSIQESYANYILTNYMLLQSWKIPVVTNTKHSVLIGWAGRKFAKLLTYNVNIGFNTNTNEYLPSYSYFSTLKIQNYVSGVIKSNNTFLNTGISKYLFSLRTSVSGNFTIQKSGYEQLQQNQLTKFADVRQTLSIKVLAKIYSWLTGSCSIMYTNSRSKNFTQDSLPQQKASQLTQHVELFFFPLRGMAIKLSADKYQTMRNKIQLLDAFFADAQVLYQFRKTKTELSLEATNLTGVKEYTTVTVSGNNNTQVNFPLRHPQVMVSIRFRF